MLKKIIAFFLVFGLLCPIAYAADEAYDEMAEELSENAKLLKQPKIAIIPFTYVDKRKSEGGLVVSERLTTRIVKLKKFQVIERHLLENVLTELHLETSGVVDAKTTKEIGKVLGVEAIITGTLLDVGNGQTEINARIIRAETAEVIATASGIVQKFWKDISEVEKEMPQQLKAQETQREERQDEPKQEPAPRKKREGYFDIFLGNKSGAASIQFDNSSRNILETELGVDLDNSGTISASQGYSKIAFDDVNAEGQSSPIGIRFISFGKNWGFGWEISSMNHTVSAQNTKVSLSEAAGTAVTIPSDEFLSVNTLSVFPGDLLYRFAKKRVQPYVGAGLSFSFNTLKSAYMQQSSGNLEEFSIGFMTRFPIIGIRIFLGKKTAFLFEFRNISNTMAFTRGFSNESDRVTISGQQILMGVSFRIGKN